jgi:hypothetical protein
VRYTCAPRVQGLLPCSSVFDNGVSGSSAGALAMQANTSRISGVLFKDNSACRLLTGTTQHSVLSLAFAVLQASSLLVCGHPCCTRCNTRRDGGAATLDATTLELTNVTMTNNTAQIGAVSTDEQHVPEQSCCKNTSATDN